MAKQIPSLEDIKAQYGDVVEISVSDYKAYLKKPNRYVIGNFMSKVNINMVVACEEMYKACVIEELSDKEILEDDDLFMSIMGELSALIELKKSSSKKI